MSKLVAAYGTLRKGFGNNRAYLSNQKHLGTGKTVEKFKMYASGIPFVVKDEKEDNIVVDVYEVEDGRPMNSVDALEGHPRWYKREEIDIDLKGKIIKAWLYFMPLANKEKLTYVKQGDYTTYRKP